MLVPASWVERGGALIDLPSPLATRGGALKIGIDFNLGCLADLSMVY